MHNETSSISVPRTSVGYEVVMERHPSESCVDLERVLDRVGLIGQSRAHRRTIAELSRFAAVDVPVLLQGPTGTGKELAARAVHYLSARRGGPFIPVDCGALPDTLFEGELFGHVRGAFTDARQHMRGLIAQGERGTLFIDEIQTLGKRSQASLLRFLQDQTYRPLGGERASVADVRIVVATNRSLEEGVSRGWFRDDLYYRLNVASITLPPLSDRTDDIPLLVNLFLARFARRYQLPPKRFDAGALAWLMTRSWPGNVRELENFVHREFLRSEADVITLEALPAEHDNSCEGASRHSPPIFNTARAEALAKFESSYLRTLLAAASGNVSEAARRAGKERRLFGRMMKRNGIDREEFQR
jgi:two-component system, NtrC family, response regulator GlrR